MRQPAPTLRIRAGSLLTRILCLSLCLPAALSIALPDDREKPIHISADKAVRDEKNGMTIYSGNVQMSQGSMELEADVLTIYHPSEEAEKFVAEGKPAKMRQQPDVDEGVVHAHAEVIEYFRLEDRVHLRTDARIEQDGAVVNGDTIDYFIDKEVIQAQSDQASAGDKVVVVIPPSMTKDDDKQADQPGAESGGNATQARSGAEQDSE